MKQEHPTDEEFDAMMESDPAWVKANRDSWRMLAKSTLRRAERLEDERDQLRKQLRRNASAA